MTTVSNLQLKVNDKIYFIYLIRKITMIGINQKTYLNYMSNLTEGKNDKLQGVKILNMPTSVSCY